MIGKFIMQDVKYLVIQYKEAIKNYQRGLRVRPFVDAIGRQFKAHLYAQRCVSCYFFIL